MEYVRFEAPHNFHKPSREAVYTFFSKVFLGKDGSPVAERNAPVPDARDLLVLWNHLIPGHARSFPELFADWRAMSDSQAAQPDLGRLRQRLAMAIEASLPARVETATEGSQVVLSAGKGDRVPLHLRKGSASSKEAVILVHPDGGTAALASQDMLTRAGKDAVVYAPDLYQTGTAKAPVTERHQHHVTFNLSDDAQRVQDLLTTVAYAKAQGATRIRILGHQQASAWAILAAAMSNGSALVEAPPFSAHPEWGYDEWLAEHCFIPGLQRAGGIPAALRVLGVARQ